MKLFKSMALYFENAKLKKEIERLETVLEATEKRLDEKIQDHRKLLGDKTMLKEKAKFLDRSLYNTNKIIEEIIETAESNDLGNSRTKVKKILELAKSETHKP